MWRISDAMVGRIGASLGWSVDSRVEEVPALGQWVPALGEEGAMDAEEEDLEAKWPTLRVAPP
jgi:hypothetical protein